MCAIVETALKNHGADHWYSVLTAASVPAGPINDLAEAFAFARRLGIEATVPVPGTATPQVANPITLSQTPVTYRSGPPGLGADQVDDSGLSPVTGITSPPDCDGEHVPAANSVGL